MSGLDLKSYTSLGDSTNSTRSVRIIHISDTHMQHDTFLDSIPHGDILIHSGDFSSFSPSRYLFSNKNRDRDSVIHEINSFFKKLPHKYKIFVAGNHELSFTDQHKNYIEQNITEAIYLHDKMVEIEGLKIYGSPWTSKRATSYARGSSIPRKDLVKHWDKIPTETDILITHMPPEGIMDLGKKKFAGIRNLFSSNEQCEVCGNIHEDTKCVKSSEASDHLA